MLPPHPPGLNYPQGAARALLQLLSMLLKSLEDDQTVYAEKKSAAQKALLDEFVLGLPEGHPHMKRQAQLIQDGQNLFTVYANKKKKTNQSIGMCHVSHAWICLKGPGPSPGLHASPLLLTSFSAWVTHRLTHRLLLHNA